MYRTKIMLSIDTYIEADNGVIEFVETNGSNLTEQSIFPNWQWCPIMTLPLSVSDRAKIY